MELMCLINLLKEKRIIEIKKNCSMDTYMQENLGIFEIRTKYEEAVEKIEDNLGEDYISNRRYIWNDREIKQYVLRICNTKKLVESIQKKCDEDIDGNGRDIWVKGKIINNSSEYVWIINYINNETDFTYKKHVDREYFKVDDNKKIKHLKEEEDKRDIENLKFIEALP